VFEQGDEGDAMYVIESGGVDIQTGSEKQRVVLASLYNGQYFGELSLLDGAPRSARVVTTRDSVLLLLERDDFVDFVKRRPDAALAIMSELGERMRATNELMTRTVSKNAFDEVEERLTIGDRVADKVASFGGSWPFIFLFGGFMLVWMTWNSLAGGMAFDPAAVHVPQPVPVHGGRAAGAVHHDEPEPSVDEGQGPSRSTTST
jgi:CRP/FNR family cyclic AMP-dependent transcriptional regulator